MGTAQEGLFMKTTVVIAVAVAMSGGLLVAQEGKRVPKDSVRVRSRMRQGTSSPPAPALQISRAVWTFRKACICG